MHPFCPLCVGAMYDKKRTPLKTSPDSHRQRGPRAGGDSRSGGRWRWRRGAPKRFPGIRGDLQSMVCRAIQPPRRNRRTVLCPRPLTQWRAQRLCHGRWRRQEAPAEIASLVEFAGPCAGPPLSLGADAFLAPHNIRFAEAETPLIGKQNFAPGSNWRSLGSQRQTTDVSSCTVLRHLLSDFLELLLAKQQTLCRIS